MEKNIWTRGEIINFLLSEKEFVKVLSSHWKYVDGCVVLGHKQYCSNCLFKCNCSIKMEYEN